jgi:hypothetical protein
MSEPNSNTQPCELLPGRVVKPDTTLFRPRDLRTDPLTTRERDTGFYAAKFRALGHTLERFAGRHEQTMHDRSIAASRADVYLRIATLFDDLTLIDEAGRIGAEPAYKLVRRRRKA